MNSPILIAVDANRLLSALLGGWAARLLRARSFAFSTTERVTWEAQRYLDVIAAKTGIEQIDLYLTLKSYPFDVIPEREYASAIPRASDRIGGRDPKDIDLLALALHLQCPIWTHDRDFESVSEVRVLHDRDVATLISLSTTE